MIRSDYILRMIEEFVRMLARIRSLKKGQRWAEASEDLDAEFKQLVGVLQHRFDDAENRFRAEVVAAIEAVYFFENLVFAQARILQRASHNRDCSQTFPFLQFNFAVEDGFDLSDEHSDLRHGVFRIRGNCLAVRTNRHELVAGAGIRTGEAQRPQFADEVTPLKWAPAGHS